MMETVQGFMEMQKNNKSIISDHIAAARWYSFGKFDKVTTELGKCSLVAGENQKICQSLLTKAKTMIKDLREGRKSVQVDREDFKANETRIENIKAEKESLKEALKQNEENCRKQQETHDKQMNKMVQDYENTMSTLMTDAEKDIAKASADVASSQNNLQSAHNMNTMVRSGWWVFSSSKTSDKLVQQKNDAIADAKNQRQRAEAAGDAAQMRKVEALNT